MIRTILGLGLVLALAGPAEAVDKDCAGMDPSNTVARDRAVVLFHWACGMRLAEGCDFRANPELIDSKKGLDECIDGGPAGKLGAIAGHVLQWEINHGCEGNVTCIKLHKDICLGKGNSLQQKRRLLRCSKASRNQLNGWTADILKGKTGTNSAGEQDVFSHKFGAWIAESLME